MTAANVRKGPVKEYEKRPSDTDTRIILPKAIRRLARANGINVSKACETELIRRLRQEYISGTLRASKEDRQYFKELLDAEYRM